MDDSSIPQLKPCSKCGIPKPATSDYFYRSRGKLRSICKDCRAVQRGAKRRVVQPCENPHDRRCSKCNRCFPATTEFFNRHRKDKLGLYTICKECHRSASLIRHRSNPQADRDSAKRWQHQNPNRARENGRKYRLRHPEKQRVRVQRRRAIQRSLPHTFTEDDWRYALEYWGGRCCICGSEPSFWLTLAREHWIAQSKGGGFTADNIVPMCHSRPGIPSGQPSCNQSKGNKAAVEWLIERFGKRKAMQIEKRIKEYFDRVKSRQS